MANASLDLDRLTDLITNLIDHGIRKQKFVTYEEWQEAVSAVVMEWDAGIMRGNVPTTPVPFEPKMTPEEGREFWALYGVHAETSDIGTLESIRARIQKAIDRQKELRNDQKE